MMEELTDLQRHTVNILRTRPKGKEITGKEVASLIGLRPRDTGKEGADMRAIINALRRKGYPICASTNGYYYPATKEEIDEYCASLQARIDSETQALLGIKEGIREWETWRDHRLIEEEKIVEL